MINITFTGENAKEIRTHVFDMAATFNSEKVTIEGPAKPQVRIMTLDNTPLKPGRGRPAGVKNKNGKVKSKKRGRRSRAQIREDNAAKLVDKQWAKDKEVTKVTQQTEVKTTEESLLLEPEVKAEPKGEIKATEPANKAIMDAFAKRQEEEDGGDNLLVEPPLVKQEQPSEEKKEKPKVRKGAAKNPTYIDVETITLDLVNKKKAEGKNAVPAIKALYAKFTVNGKPITSVAQLKEVPEKFSHWIQEVQRLM